jgi:hypothetical protein
MRPSVETLGAESENDRDVGLLRSCLLYSESILCISPITIAVPNNIEDINALCCLLLLLFLLQSSLSTSSSADPTPNYLRNYATTASGG